MFGSCEIEEGIGRPRAPAFEARTDGRVCRRMEPLEKEPLGDARGPGLPGRKGAWREWVVNERRLRDTERLAHLDPAPADDMHCLGSRGEPVRPLVERVVFGRPSRQSVARVDRGLQAGLEGANGSPSCALSGVMQSQPSMNSVASCRSSRSPSPAVSAPSASRIASTVRLCWATESGCSHRDAPPHRMVRERPAARSSSVQASGSGLRRSRRRRDRKSTKARGAPFVIAVILASPARGAVAQDVVPVAAFDGRP